MLYAKTAQTTGFDLIYSTVEVPRGGQSHKLDSYVRPSGYERLSPIAELRASGYQLELTPQSFIRMSPWSFDRL